MMFAPILAAAGYSAYTFDVEWRLLNDVGNETLVTGIQGLSYELTGLTAGTDYEFRVREDVGGSKSSWTEWFTGTTTGSGGGATLVSLFEQSTPQNTFSVIATSSNSIIESTEATSSFTSISSVILSISDSVFASDTPNDLSQADLSVEEEAISDELKTSIAQASEALSEGIISEEEWTDSVVGILSLSEQATTEDLYETAQIILTKVSLSEETDAQASFISALNAITNVNESLTLDDAFVLFASLTTSIQESIEAFESFSSTLQANLEVSEQVSTEGSFEYIQTAFGAFLFESVQAIDLYQASVFAEASVVSSTQPLESYTASFSNEVRSLLISSITLSAAFKSQRIKYKPAMSRLNIELTPKK